MPRRSETPATARLRHSAQAWEALLRSQSHLMRSFEAAGDFDPLTAREYDVLFNLAQAGGSLAMSDLVAEALLSQPSMSRMVDRLARKGLLRRQPHPRDRRAVQVLLTARGRDLQRAIGRRHVRTIAEKLAPLTDAELTQLTQLCTKLRRDRT